VNTERIDEYIKELEAIKYYDKVKAENESLKIKVKELEEELKHEKSKVNELIQAKSSLEDKLNAKINEVESLSNELKVRDEEIIRLNSKVKELSSNIKVLEDLKVTVEGKTMKDTVRSILRAKDKKIEEYAIKMFNEWKEEWEKNDKPKEVLEKAIFLLNHTIDQLNNNNNNKELLLKEVVDAGLDKKVKEIIDSEIERRMDAEFTKRVEEESNRKANEKLEELKEIELPIWYNTYVEPRIMQLEAKIKDNALKALEGPWNITCDRCKTKLSVKINAYSIEYLLSKGYIEIECVNPNCLDISLFSNSRHKITVNLRNIIQLYLTHEQRFNYTDLLLS
jgi:hypothetical protein